MEVTDVHLYVCVCVCVYVCVFLFICPPCVCAFLRVHYHLHWVCEHHTVEANEVLVVQGVHGVDLTDEVLQSVGLAEHICLQTLHSYVQLEKQERFQPFSVIYMADIHRLIIKTAPGVHPVMHLLLFIPTSAHEANKMGVLAKQLQLCDLLSLQQIVIQVKCEVRVSSPPFLQVSATLLFSPHRTSRPPASRTVSGPSPGWGRSEPAAARQEERHRHRAVWAGLPPPGQAEV